MARSELPLRLATGPFLLWSGLRKLQRPEVGDELLLAAARSLPQLEDVFGGEPERFARLAGALELLLGAWLSSGLRRRAGGLALAAYAGAALSLLWSVPGNRVAGSAWEPSEQGRPVAKDVWLLGIGLALALGR